jgi:energy-coupling factor transporter transmembrane protein EcfT
MSLMSIAIVVIVIVVVLVVVVLVVGVIFVLVVVLVLVVVVLVLRHTILKSPGPTPQLIRLTPLYGTTNLDTCDVLNSYCTLCECHSKFPRAYVRS